MNATKIATLAFVATACAVVMTPATHEWGGTGPVVPHDSFPGDCSLCHVGDGWSELREDFSFDHAARTGVELTGAHTNAQCLFCHNDQGNLASIAREGCAGCHEDPHQRRFGKTCEECHATLDWRVPEIVAQHDQVGFPLMGGHLAATCWQCHPQSETGIFGVPPRLCESCHVSDLGRALDPDHAALGWTRDCRDCHTPLGWTAGGFDHLAFPLTGAHIQADCTACHVDNVFAGTPSNCADCHLGDYQAALDPDHAGLGFSMQCEQCHTTFDWEAAFDHRGIVDGCFACHQDDYEATADPNHAAEGFSTACEQCHTAVNWEGAFNHDGIVDGCFACHQDDYVATTDPDHASSGFSTACEVCHATNQWEGAVFIHMFPINNGDHAGLDCADCHTPSAPAPAFSCTHCHEHSESQTFDDHDEVSGYVWESVACRDCHPAGKSDLLLSPSQTPTGRGRRLRKDPTPPRKTPGGGGGRVPDRPTVPERPVVPGRPALPTQPGSLFVFSANAVEASRAPSRGGCPHALGSARDG